MSEEYISYQEVMSIVKASRSTIWVWVNDEKMGFPQPFKIGRKLLWKRSEIESYIESTRKPRE